MLVGLFFDRLGAAQAWNEEQISVREISYDTGLRAFFLKYQSSGDHILIGIMNPSDDIKWVKMLDRKIFNALSRRNQELLLRYCPFFPEYKQYKITKEYY